MNQPNLPRKNTHQDIIIITILSVLAFWVASTIDVFELLIKLFHQYEEWQIDKFFTIAIIFTIALSIFLWRRWQECEHELAYRQWVQVQLQEAKEAAETEKKRADIAQTKAKIAREKAEIDNRAKSEFLAGMSHELRTPFNSILGHTQILLRDKTLNANQQEALHSIQKSGEYLLTLINDILDLSKVETQKIELHPQHFRFREFLQNIVDLIQERTNAKNIDFKYDFDVELPITVNGDETRLRQVLVNLLGNAVKLTTQNQVTFKVKKSDRQSPTSNQTNDKANSTDFQFPLTNIRFQIEDTSTGLAPEPLKNLFQPFQPAETKNRLTKESCLGLPLSQKMIEIMGGTLKAESIIGKGNIFWFELQLAEIEQWQPHEMVPGTTIKGYQGEQYKLLIIEKNLTNRMILFGLFISVGFDVIEAEDNQEGLEQAQTLLPDIIIMDEFEAIRQIRQNPTLKDVIIIAALSNTLAKQREKCLEAGCDDFITKPIQTNEILEKLQKHLNLKWIYEAENQPQDSIDLVSQPMIGPPANIAKVLYQLAMMGDIQGIIKQATELKHKESQLEPFAEQIQQLANRFQIEQLRQFIEPYL